MARIFRLWQKKRGARQTGSRMLGGVGEALFFAGLFLAGAVLLTVQISSVFRDASAAPFGFLFWLKIVAESCLVLIGLGGVLYTVLHVGASVERRSALAAKLESLRETPSSQDEFPCIPNAAPFNDSPGIRLAYRLPVVAPTVWNLTAATLFCLVWNGITAVLAVLAINSLQAGTPDWVLLGCMPPFLVIGVWALRYFIRQMLIHTGIGPTSVELSEHPLLPGRTYQVFVTQSGRLSLKSLQMILVCEEEATYRQGTDVRTETQAVRESAVFRRENFRIEPGMPFEHQCELTVPDDGMHSFQSRHNSVHWKLVVQGDAESWPRFERSFPVIIYPSSPAPSPEPSSANAQQTSR